MFGLLNINKPVDVTSREVVTKVVRLLRESTGKKIKAGHAGTLDPLASGVLVVCLGKATRLIPYIHRFSKVYVGNFDLDVTSPSADSETEISFLENPIRPSRQLVETRLPDFLGKIDQKPPAYSAISVGGQKAYRLARQGIPFKIQPKQVEISRLEIIRFEYPELELLIECGTGTYIRSLGRDLARSINSDAVMKKLARKSIGPFRVEESIPCHELSPNEIGSRLIDPITALGEMHRLVLKAEEQDLLVNGRFIDSGRFDIPGEKLPDEMAGIDEHQKLLAILEPRSSQLKSKINFFG